MILRNPFPGVSTAATAAGLKTLARRSARSPPAHRRPAQGGRCDGGPAIWGRRPAAARCTLRRARITGTSEDMPPIPDASRSGLVRRRPTPDAGRLGGPQTVLDRPSLFFPTLARDLPDLTAPGWAAPRSEADYRS